jgi:hypothetical protein
MAAVSSIMLGLAIGGLATQAYGSWKAGSAAKKAGEAQQRAADSQAELSEFNSDVAELQAADALARGAEEEARFRSMVRTSVGAQVAAFAGSNIDVGFGSAVDVQADAAYLGELDAQTIRNNAMREAWGYNVEAEDSRRRADITRREGVMLAEAGRQNQTNARIGAIGSLAIGTGSLLQQRYGFNKA